MKQRSSVGATSMPYRSQPRSLVTWLLTICAIAIGLCHRDAIGQQLDQKPTVQTWYGEMDTGTRVFRFVIASQSAKINEAATAELTSLDEGSMKFTLQDFINSDTELQFKIKSTKAVYDGKRNSSDSNVQGFWAQSGAKFPLDLRLVPESVAKKSIADKPTEVWKGTLKAGLQKIEMQLRGYLQQDGSIQYYVDSVSQKAGGFKAKSTRKEDELVLDIPGLRAKFTGKIEKDAQRMKGKWIQGVAFDLDLDRELTPALETSDVEHSTVAEDKPVNRPQNPKPPFPYKIREIQFPAQDGTIQLSGTLTLPSAASESNKQSLAILITGSGPQDRDETLFDHKPFWVLADHLTRNGVAVLRYDERGVGQSQGEFGNATTRDFANDVQSAVQFARNLPEIDSNKIGLIGHSEGGLVAPMVAVDEPGIAWIVMMAGTGVNGKEILYSQGALIAAAEGVPEKDLKQQRKIQELVFETVPTIDANIDLSTILDTKVADLFAQLATDDASVKDLTDTQKSELHDAMRLSLMQCHSPWFRYFLTHEPGPVLERVRCPVLAINGSKDLQVSPELNLPAIEQSLKKGGNQNVSIRKMDGLNHLFQTTATGAVSEYGTLEETISPGVLEAISTWILARQ
jgi:uncharacterized protein